jgi:hypothetical protein
MKYIKTFKEFISEIKQFKNSSINDYDLKFMQESKTKNNKTNFLKVDKKDKKFNFDKDTSKLVDEKKIGEIEDQIEIRVEIDTTNHAEERKTRHGDQKPITNEMIIKTVEAALEDIADYQLKKVDKIGQKYWIYDTSTDLNVIGTIEKKYGELIFLVITVMIEPNFRASPDAKKIVL